MMILLLKRQQNPLIHDDSRLRRAPLKHSSKDAEDRLRDGCHLDHRRRLSLPRHMETCPRHQV